tara:strand:+ start:2487 stop:3698 length:1212 start_codon:yes stop_codon:yes gene_type:complete
MVYCKLVKNKKLVCKKTDNKKENEPQHCEFNEISNRCNRLTIAKIKKNKMKNLKSIFKKEIVKVTQKIKKLERSIKDDKKSILLGLSKKAYVSVHMNRNIQLLEKLNSGGTNIIYSMERDQNSDEDKIFRSSKYYDYSQTRIQSLIYEAELNLRLSYLGLTPKIYDIFFAFKTDDDKERININYIIERADYNLNDFIYQKKLHNLSTEEIVGLAKQVKMLFKRMIDNDIICTDIKLHNIVLTKKNDSFFVKLIDFDTRHCSFHKMENSFKKILGNMEEKIVDHKQNIVKFDKTLFQKNILSLSLLMVSMYKWVEPIDGLFFREIVSDIQVYEIPLLARLCEIKIGDQTSNFGFILRYYYLHELKNIHNNCKKNYHSISNSTALLGCLSIALFGGKAFSNNCLP